MGAPVVYFEITGKNGANLQEFYNAVFGWSMTATMPGYARIGDAGAIAGGIREEKEAGAERVLYVQVPELKAALATIEAAGGKTIIPPTNVPGVVHFALFEDPQGNRMGLIQP
ncbi:MAG: VOC family protein [bacterium]